ncbi:repressor LexA [Clostridium chromiireducens]|uniref:Repressor LexA n=1 Tax=Clostridium chromiireducens TaxID=225345 RepID=A0A399ISJ8_9CLOT|nr:transcriptional repressor LexA [Clostridium chromiireducens]RII33926.1 repressor LexA [Clostridium chromiireducens]
MYFNKEQKKIINSKPNGHMLIKGEKGTGKTTTFINKIPSLLNHYCISKDDKILVATRDEEASTYVSYIYDNIETEKYHQSSFFDRDNSDKLEISNITSLIYYYFNQYKNNNKKNDKIASSEECYNQLKDAIKTILNKYENKKPSILNLDFAQFIQEEIRWIKSSNYINLEEYQAANRFSRTNDNLTISAPKVLRKNSKQRQAVFDILIEYNNNLKKINKIDFEDVAILALKEASTTLKRKFTHIFIDDCQMLTKVEIEFLKALYNEKTYSSITFLFENSASKNSKTWLTSGKSFASLGYDMKGKSITLKTKHSETLNECRKDNEVNEKKVIECSITQNVNSIKDTLINQPLKLDTVRYIDLKRNVHHSFIKDSGTVNEIYVEHDGIEERVVDVIEIPVFSEIAAGNPILMNEYIEDNYYLPKDWVRSTKDVFMLKVKGDSMINKNIYDGDYVVISKQGMPSINDIVAVDIEGEATLKTYKKINRQIVLMPENEMYEPIFITDQQFSFLGVAIGLVKNS